VRKVHDFLTVGAAAPLQTAGAYALTLPPSYYDQLQSDYRARRDLILPELEKAVGTFSPDGAYYVMTDISGFGFKNDVEFTRHLIREIALPAYRARVSTAIPRWARNKCGSAL